MRQVLMSITVELDEEGRPVRLSYAGRRRSVQRVLDSWLYGGRWWRGEGPRAYFFVQLVTGEDAELYREGETWVLSRLGD